MERNAGKVKERSLALKKFWAPRNAKMREWYKLIQMVDQLKTENMESFVGNDPRALFNLTLHLLNSKIPHRLDVYETDDLSVATANAEVSKFFDKVWAENEHRFRHVGPRGGLLRTAISFMLSTGWYAFFAIPSQDGSFLYIDSWNPAEVFPMWDYEAGLSEVAHICEYSKEAAERFARRNGWPYKAGPVSSVTLYDYWWIDYEQISPIVWNAIVMGDSLVKFEPTPFKKIRIYTGPVGGLPDTGPLSEGTSLSTSSFNAGSVGAGDRWKEELGQAIVATNEFIYKTWNKWWSFSLQLLRDTAQPRIFERSRSGKNIVKPEDVFKRGSVWRGGPDDAVDFVTPPAIPLELRSSQLDMEAMMQRGGVNWALQGGSVAGLTAYTMSQIAASANQVMKPFHEAIINVIEDIDNDFLNDVRDGIRPYNWTPPTGLPKESKVIADYEIEVPGDLVQRATVARMLDPNFKLSYQFVMRKLFPEIKDYLREVARTQADDVQRGPVSAAIAAVGFYRSQAEFLRKAGDNTNARLYELAADAAMAQIQPPEQLPQAPSRPAIGNRTEAVPQIPPPGGI